MLLISVNLFKLAYIIIQKDIFIGAYKTTLNVLLSIASYFISSHIPTVSLLLYFGEPRKDSSEYHVISPLIYFLYWLSHFLLLDTFLPSISLFAYHMHVSV